MAVVGAAEKEIDGPPTELSGADADQTRPSLVSLGQNKGYFATWHDPRGTRPGIYGARIGTDGIVKDPTGIPIVTGVDTPLSLGLAIGTNEMLVTWTVEGAARFQPPGVYALRLDLDGKVLDKEPIAIATKVSPTNDAHAAFGGNEWLVTWSGYDPSATASDIYGARVSAAGALLDSAPLRITNAPSFDSNPNVLFDGAKFFVWYRSSVGGVEARFCALDGTLSPGQVNLSTATNSIASVSFANDTYAVVWSQQFPPASGSDVLYRHFTSAGVPVEGAPVLLTSDSNFDDTPRVVFDGQNELVTWIRDNGRLVAQRIGVDASPTEITTEFFGYSVYALASDRGGSLAITPSRSDLTPSGADIMGVRIATTPTAASQSLVSRSANAETEPSIVWTGSSYVATWLDNRGGQSEIWGARLAADGTADAPKLLFSQAKLNELSHLRIATDGDGALVTFYASSAAESKRGVRAIRVNSAGSPDPAGPIDVTYAPITELPSHYDREPDVAFDGTNYLVVWQREELTRTWIEGTRIAKSGGARVDTPLLVISPNDTVVKRRAPSIGFDGQNYFVAWVESEPNSSSVFVTHISGTRIGKDGVSLDGAISLCDAFLLQRAPSVAGNPVHGGFMVVWEDLRSSVDRADIFGARVSPQGQNLDAPKGMKISAGPSDESAPRVTAAGDGANFVVTWQDLRSKTNYDVYGAWISRAGTNHDPGGFAIAKDVSDEELPVILSSSSTTFLAAYQRLDPQKGYGSYRIRTRTIDGGLPMAAACTKNDDCASRSCADGVCCSTECGDCGVCNVSPGTCTPRAAGSQSATCPAYKCKGDLACPSTCETDGDCTVGATCDPSSHQCLARKICIGDHTLQDSAGKLIDCAPYSCIGDACRTKCASTDDCASGFTCDSSAHCVPITTPPPPSDSGDDGCNTSGRSTDGAEKLALAWVVATLARKRKRTV